jgi:hypothetical protein
VRLHLSFAGDPACPSETQVREALVRRFSKDASGRERTTVVSAAPATGELSLHIRSSSSPSMTGRADAAGRLTITLADGTSEPTVERVLEGVQGDCAEVAEAIALMVDSWLRKTPLSSFGHLAAPRPLRAPVQMPARAPNGPAAPAVVSEARAEQPPSPAEPDSPPASPALPPPAPDGAAPAQPLFTLTLDLLGGACLAEHLQSGGQGSAAVELGFGRYLGVAVQGTVTSRVTATAEPGSVGAWTWALTLLLRLSLHERARAGIDLLAGGGFERIAAASEGYGSDKSAILYDGQLLLAVRWRQPLWRGLSASATLEATSRLHEEQFGVAGVGPVLTLPAMRFSLAVGAAWTFF